MLRFGIALALTVLLASCASTRSITPEQSCFNQGFSKGTKDYSDCVSYVAGVEQRAANRQAPAPQPVAKKTNVWDDCEATYQKDDKYESIRLYMPLVINKIYNEQMAIKEVPNAKQRKAVAAFTELYSFCSKVRMNQISAGENYSQTKLREGFREDTLANLKKLQAGKISFGEFNKERKEGAASNDTKIQAARALPGTTQQNTSISPEQSCVNQGYSRGTYDFRDCVEYVSGVEQRYAAKQAGIQQPTSTASQARIIKRVSDNGLTLTLYDSPCENPSYASSYPYKYVAQRQSDAAVVNSCFSLDSRSQMVSLVGADGSVTKATLNDSPQQSDCGFFCIVGGVLKAITAGANAGYQAANAYNPQYAAPTPVPSVVHGQQIQVPQAQIQQPVQNAVPIYPVDNGLTIYSKSKPDNIGTTTYQTNKGIMTCNTDSIGVTNCR